MSFWVSLKHFLLLKRRQNLRYTILVCWLLSRQVIGLKQVYTVQCVTVPLFWLTSGQLIGLKQLYALHCVVVPVCWLASEQVIGPKQVYAVQCVTMHTIDLQNFGSLILILRHYSSYSRSYLCIELHALPVLALCVVLWEKSRKEWRQTSFCTVFDQYDYCSTVRLYFVVPY